MSQRKKENALKQASAAAFIANTNNYLTDEELFFRRKTEEMQAKNAVIFLAVVGSGANKIKKEKKVPVQAKPLTKTQEAAIKQETKKGLKALTLLPLPPYTVILPAPGLGKMNPAELCNYCVDKFVRIESVPEMAGCSPSIDFNKAIYEVLLPLAAQGKDISSGDRVSLKLYTKQLKENFGSTLSSIANICNGNMQLFALINVAVRKKGARNTKRLAAPVVTITNTHGANTLRVKCKPIKYAKSYTVLIGTGDDLSTYKTYTGNSSQLIGDLTAGELVTVIMCANTGKQAGFNSIAQQIRVPY